jgi:hypothetical protein
LYASAVDDGDVKALADDKHRIHSELNRHQTMKKLADRIRKLPRN